MFRRRVDRLSKVNDAEIRFFDKKIESGECVRLFLFALTNIDFPHYLETRKNHFVYAF